ncbi:MAG: hypothetical protein BGO43_00645 [Gammaproteobacteria bacterium 39-13]|mgnify:CR=1 FL=1|nr:hypothetical protein [Gammaproteobacteria bacterium]OJV96764.1 MAG: hypothetical protein BGO43_00645 [Gammaproteobacteria bacterium 39-13]
MTISEIANQVSATVRYFKDAIKNSIVVFSGFFVNFITNLPRNIPLFFQGILSTFKAGLNLGKEALIFLFEIAKYTLTHFTDVMKFLYEGMVFLLKHIPELIQFGFDLIKSIVRNALDLGKWFVRNLPHVITHTIGFILGGAYAAIELGRDFFTWCVNTLFNRRTNATSQAPEQRIDHVKNADLVQPLFERSSSLTPQFKQMRNQASAVGNDNLAEVSLEKAMKLR